MDVLREEAPLNTGMEGKMYVGKSPLPVTPDVLEDGQTEFNIYCAPCHDQTGYGKGVVARGSQPGSPPI